MIDCDLLVILDRSGSMQARQADHEGGVRSFVEDQRTLSGDVRFTLVQFDTTDPCEVVYDRVPLDRVGEIHLIPRGGTPLLDAIGRAVAHLREAQQNIERAKQTVVMIVTDGEENSSTEWTKAQVVRLLDQLKAEGVSTLFLGAGIDAFAEAGSMGIAFANTLAVPDMAANLSAAYNVTSSKVKLARSMTMAGASGGSVAAAMSYNEDERATVTNAGGGGTTGTYGGTPDPANQNQNQFTPPTPQTPE